MIHLTPKDYEMLKRYRGLDPDEVDLLDEWELDQELDIVRETLREIIDEGER